MIRCGVSTRTPAMKSSHFLVMATGCLSMPKAAEIEGLDQFAGDVLHQQVAP